MNYALVALVLSVFIPRSIPVGPVLLAPVDLGCLALLSVWLMRTLLLRRAILVPKFYMLIVVFLLGILASLFSAINIYNSLKEMLQFIQLSVLYTFVPYNVVTKEKTVHRMLAAAVFGAAILAASAIYFFLKTGGPEGVYALGFHKNALGSFMALCLPLAVAQFRQRPSAWYFGLLVCIAGGLLASYSRGAWVGAFVGLIVVESLFQKRNLVWLVVALGIAVLLYPLMPDNIAEKITSKHTLEMRQEQWDIAMTGFNRHLLTGVGYANFLLLSREHSIVRQHEDPHNILLRLAAETGVVGLLMFGFLFAGIYRYCYRVIRRETDPALQFWERGIFASLIAYLVHGMFDVFWVRGTGSLFWILVGLIVVLYERRKELRV